ncbi:hypothetical protein OSB04_023325 [Centaurea solstitialis]|uniref:Reverse transcriptase domain-containing protein n=1 Tax=Centaurea solstitialis TaxID=347529 RepID=A0AA38SRG7_9ASTR|nr:hypothetical protein OSB04_023325 [Centaurea solstitialis]
MATTTTTHTTATAFAFAAVLTGSCKHHDHLQEQGAKLIEAINLPEYGKGRGRFGEKARRAIEGYCEAIGLGISSIGVKMQALPTREKKRCEAPGSSSSVLMKEDEKIYGWYYKLVSEPRFKGFDYSQEMVKETELRAGAPERGMGITKKTVRPTEEEEETSNLREMIASEVGEALQDLLPGLFAKIKDDLKQEIRTQVEAVMGDRANGSGGSNGGQARVTSYKDFMACQPPQFDGQKHPIASSRWLADVEGAFLTSACSEEVKVRYASNLLRKARKDWWNIVEIERLTSEFLQMRQTTESVNEITDLFLERSVFCLDYMANDRMKRYRYLEILKPEIREFVAISQCKSFQQMYEVAQTRELELERPDRKKKVEPALVQTQQAKRPKQLGPRVEVKKEIPCLELGHIASQCSKAGPTQSSGAVSTKTAGASTGKKVDPPRTRASMFQLMAEEAKEEPYVVTGTFSVNSVPALVLFDSGASKSFVSLSFCKSFMNVKGRLDKPLEVEIAAEDYRLCRDVIEIEGVKFNIDLIPIPMREINGVDWMSQ